MKSIETDNEAGLAGNKFLEQVADTIHKACEFRKKAIIGGFITLEENIIASKIKQRDIFDYGIQQAITGMDSERIDRSLSNLIALEPDKNARRLKQIEKDAVLYIHEKIRRSEFLYMLISHIDNAELEAVMRLLSGTDIFQELRYEICCALPDDEQFDFTERLAYIVNRACQFGEKARREGFVALDDIIDEQKRAYRDIFEYGLRFAVDGTCPKYINKILSNLIAQESDAASRRLKTIQKEAVLSLQEGCPMVLFVATLLSYINNEEQENLTQVLFGTDSFDTDISEDGSLANEKALGSKFFIPAEFFKILNKLLEEPLGSSKAIDIVNRLASGLQVNPLSFDSAPLLNLIRNKSSHDIADILFCLEPDKAAYIVKNLSHSMQSEVISLIASIDCIMAEVLNIIEQVTLEEPISPMPGEENIKVTGMEKAAKILELVGPATKQRIIKALKENDSVLTEKIRKHMFRFEDIVMLDDRSIQKILLEADFQELVEALKGADELVQNKIFRNMSRRAAIMSKEDMEYIGRISQEDIKEAQERISAIICHLEDLDEIVIPGSSSFAIKYGEVLVPKEFFKILNDLLEESLDNKNANDIISHLLLNPLMDDYPSIAAEIMRLKFIREITKTDV